MRVFATQNTSRNGKVRIRRKQTLKKLNDQTKTLEQEFYVIF